VKNFLYGRNFLQIRRILFLISKICNVKLNDFLKERYEVHTRHNEQAHFYTLPHCCYILNRIISIKIGNHQLVDSGSYYTGTTLVGRSVKMATQNPILSRLKNVRSYTYTLTLRLHVC